MSAFLVYILKVALLTAVFVLLYHLLLRRDTFHRTARIVLVSSLIISYVLPLCVITIQKPAPVTQRHEIAVVRTPSQSVVPTAVTAPSDYRDPIPVVNSIAPSRRQIDWKLILTVIYVLGTVSLISLRLLSNRKVWSVIRRGSVVMKRDGCRIVISKDKILSFYQGLMI